jgi:hypothetical protein
LKSHLNKRHFYIFPFFDKFSISYAHSRLYRVNLIVYLYFSPKFLLLTIRKDTESLLELFTIKVLKKSGVANELMAQWWGLLSGAPMPLGSRPARHRCSSSKVFPHYLCSLKLRCFTNHNRWSMVIFKYLSAGRVFKYRCSSSNLCTVSMCDLSLCTNSDIYTTICS